MNEIAKVDVHLPDTLEDLTQFVLVGKAKLNAYMIKLQSVKRLNVAQEIRDQTLQEAQEVSTALIAAEQRIGELLLGIPKSKGNQYSAKAERSAKAKTKSETIKDMGYERHEALDYQQMAKNPEIVQRVINEALAEGEVVTKASVMREIRSLKEELRKEQEKAKRSEELAEAHENDFKEMKYQYDAMSQRWKRAELERSKLEEQIKKNEDAPIEEIKRSSLVFCSGIAKFIEKYGGYVWLTTRLDEMPEYERKGFIEGVNALDSWVRTMKTNMEGKYE